MASSGVILMKEIHFLTNILLQFFKLKSVLESSTQPGARGLVDPTRFNSWAGRGVASSILPRVKKNPFAAMVKMLESKVEAQHRIDNAKMRALESKIASMDAWIQELTKTGSISDNRGDNDSDNEIDKVIDNDNDNDSDGEAIKSSMAAKISAFEAREMDRDKRVAELEQRTSFLVGLGLGLGLGLFLFNWMGKA